MVFSLVVWAQQDEMISVPVYPYLKLSPAQPLAETDDVVMQILLGEASNSCMAPVFTDISFTIATVDLADGDPQYVIYVSFTEKIREDVVCIQVYDPVDYGPRFLLGKLSAGTYKVVDRLSGSKVDRVYGSFTVSTNPIIADGFTVKGLVHDDPAPLDRASRPISGAKVYLRPKYLPLDADGSADRIIAPVTTDSTKTDEKGAFTFTDVERGYYTVSILHDGYKSVTEDLTLTGDTTVYYMMLPANASASVFGKVTLVGFESAAAQPVPGCTVTVTPTRDLIVASSEERIAVPLLRAITDESGEYMIKDIPVNYNGQLFYVTAKKGKLQGTRTVRLANLSDNQVNFSLMAPYTNYASRIVDGIEYKVMTDRQRYLNKETVKVRYSITNTTDTDVEFGPFDGGCVYDLIVSVFRNADYQKLYRAIDNPICLTVEAYIKVKAGETVTYDYPDYVLPDLSTYIPQVKEADEDADAESDIGAIVPQETNLVQLKFTARLIGEKYDSSAIGVTIDVEVDPTPPVAVAMKTVEIKQSAASFNRFTNQLNLTLSEAQNVAVNVHTLSGATVRGNNLSRHYNAGAHTLSLRNMIRSSGMYVVTVRGKTFENRFKAVKMVR